MKLTEKQLRALIREELMNEAPFMKDPLEGLRIALDDVIKSLETAHKQMGTAIDFSETAKFSGGAAAGLDRAFHRDIHNAWDSLSGVNTKIRKLRRSVK